MPRTIETLQQVLYGLYPPDFTAPGLVPRVRTRHGQDEDLIGNQYGCPRLKQMMVSFEKGEDYLEFISTIIQTRLLSPLAMAEKYNPELAKLEGVSKYIDGRPLKIDGSPRASGVLDTVSEYGHSGILPVPHKFLPVG